MSFFAVTGRPVLHSLSPILFNGYFQRHASSSHYGRLAADSAAESLELFRNIGLQGMNVTAPFKTEIIPLLQELDDAAEKIGAVNTVLAEGAILKGYNTDHLGISGALDARGIDVRGKSCLVVGAGGAGRAAVFALKQKGAEVTLLNRDRDKARQAAQSLGCAAGGLEDLPGRLQRSEVIVLAIPSGAISFGGNPFRAGQVILDADYRGAGGIPAVAASGVCYIRGEEWLRHQALPALALFMGENIPVRGMDWTETLGHGSARKGMAIALVGFMGSGKSTVGRELAARLGYAYVDTDEWIEQQAGKPIRDIFKSEGQAYFRQKEKETLGRLASEQRLVLSCGGGAVLDEDNRSLLRNHSLVIWVYTSPETALSRIDTRLRPLLEHREPLVRGRELFRQRLGSYFRSADLVVSNEHAVDRTIDKIHEEIRSAL